MDESQIVANICQHIYSSVVRLKYNMVFDADIHVLLNEELFEKVKSNFDVISVDAINISFGHLQRKAKRYHPYRPHCDNIIIQYSSFKRDDDLSDIVGKIDDDAGMYIVSKRQESIIDADNAEKRITKISRSSHVMDVYSLKMARAYGFEINAAHRFSAPLKGFKLLTCSSQDAAEVKKEECWGKLSSLGEARFEDGSRSVGLYYNSVRVGGSNTPLNNNGVVGIRLLNAGNIPYAVFSKENGAYYVSGTGLLNGQFHLAPDSRKTMDDGSKILLGNIEIVFTSSRS